MIKKTRRKNIASEFSSRAPRAGVRALLAFAMIAGSAGGPVLAQESYIEPGTLRISSTLSLEGVLSRLRPGWTVAESGLNNVFSDGAGPTDPPWRAEWGQSLLTEMAARFSRGASARVLFEVQGQYADRLWRPININHHLDDEDEHLLFREAEGRIDRDLWYLHAFSGVARGNWVADGDFFGLYPAAIPERDYLGSSSYFGVYPDNWRQDQYLNITRRHIPRGAEAGADLFGTEAAVAYGDELSWGYRESVYARWSAPLSASRLTFVYKDEDVPYSIYDDDERNRAYALSWALPFEAGHRVEAGVLYNPFRVGRSYLTADETVAGQGIGGTSTSIGVDEAEKTDALAGRLLLRRYDVLLGRLLTWSLDYAHEGVLAGNRRQLEAAVSAALAETITGFFQYTYRKPIEGPIPFIYEGTPDNIGAILASPRGPGSPFWVNWRNREAVILLTTVAFDPTPATNMFLYDPNALARWNLNADEDSGVSFAIQHRATDLRTATDRQFFFDENGGVVWESAGSVGAWPSDGFLHEARVLTRGRWSETGWMVGFAAGQSPARLGAAYSVDPSQEKPITEYFSVESRLARWPFEAWAHYGTGVWGPEENIHPAFGFAYDRLYGGGVSYNITPHTTWDLSYLAARQDDDQFVAPDLGSFDEIRTVFSHRFGFLFQFQGPSRGGFQTR